jgi:hypothetical protein
MKFGFERFHNHVSRVDHWKAVPGAEPGAGRWGAEPGAELAEKEEAAAEEPTPTAKDSVAVGHDADANADGSPGQGLGRLKQKRTRKINGSQEVDRRTAAKTGGGWADKGRIDFRTEGGALATGNGERTCLPDAVCTLLRTSSIDVKPEDVRAITPADGTDTLFPAADAYVRQFGLTLKRAA